MHRVCHSIAWSVSGQWSRLIWWRLAICRCSCSAQLPSKLQSCRLQLVWVPLDMRREVSSLAEGLMSKLLDQPHSPVSYPFSIKDRWLWFAVCLANHSSKLVPTLACYLPSTSIQLCHWSSWIQFEPTLPPTCSICPAFASDFPSCSTLPGKPFLVNTAQMAKVSCLCDLVWAGSSHQRVRLSMNRIRVPLFWWILPRVSLFVIILKRDIRWHSWRKRYSPSSNTL